jgi:hypothetical protein
MGRIGSIVVIVAGLVMAPSAHPAEPTGAGLAVTVTIARSVIMVGGPSTDPCRPRVLANIPTYETVLVEQAPSGRECVVTTIEEY